MAPVSLEYSFCFTPPLLQLDQYFLIQSLLYLINENITQFCWSEIDCIAKHNFLGFHAHGMLSHADSCSRCANGDVSRSEGHRRSYETAFLQKVLYVDIRTTETVRKTQTVS